MKNPNEVYQSNKTAMSTVENSAYYLPHKSIMLYKIKLMETMNCPYCPNETDSIEHRFYKYKKCVPLWKHVESILNAYLGQMVNIWC